MTTLKTACQKIKAEIKLLPFWEKVQFLSLTSLPEEANLLFLKKLQWHLNHPTVLYYHFRYIFPEFDQFTQTQTAKTNFILAPDHTPEEQQYLFDLLLNSEYEFPEGETGIRLVCLLLNENNDHSLLKQRLLQKLEAKLSSIPVLSSSSWTKMHTIMGETLSTSGQYQPIPDSPTQNHTSETRNFCCFLNFLSRNRSGSNNDPEQRNGYQSKPLGSQQDDNAIVLI